MCKGVIMQVTEMISRSLEQSQEYLARALFGLTQEEVVWSPGAECNSIAFILWHTTRVEDSLVNRGVQHGTVLYEANGWQEKLGTPDKAWQYTMEELQAWPVTKLEALQEYADAVRENTLAYLKSVPEEKLSEVSRPDRSPDTIGAVLTRLATEVALHVGQIAYLRGIQRGLDK